MTAAKAAGSIRIAIAHSSKEAISLKFAAKTALALLLGALLYLLVVAAWASVAFDDVMPGLPPASPLSARQTIILLAVEDPTFYRHSGLSLADGQGLATISSALARQVFLSGRQLPGVKGVFQQVYRTVFDCCKRIDAGRDVMALVLDAKLSKERQLALYAAQVYMGTHDGRQLSGLEAAAASYLGKPLVSLGEVEFIGLVAMIKAPNLYHPLGHPALHAQRVARIVALLAGKCRADGWFDTTLRHCDA